MSDVGPLLTLLSLEERALKAQTPAQLAFVMVNETRSLVEYRQAVLYIASKGVVAVSAVSSIDGNAPFILWMTRIFRALEAGREFPHADRQKWPEWLPEHPLFLPLTDGNGRRLGTLLLVRDTAWEVGSSQLAQRLTNVYALAWDARNRRGPFSRWRQSLGAVPFWRWIAAAGLFSVLLVPVRQSVLAPAEIVPHDPAVMRAPMDGVIDKVMVRPNQSISEGQVLFALDQTSITGKLDVAEKSLDAAKAELDQVTQQAFFDPKAKSQWAVAKARVEEKQAERTMLRDSLARSEVRAPRNGIAVMDDPSEWIGRPVSVGEKVLAIAAPDEVEGEAWLAPADVIALAPGAPVTLFLNIDPMKPVAAKLSYVAFKATLRPDGLLAHRVRALIGGDIHPRIGLKGTARLDGRRVSLFYWLFRRPLAVVRQRLGR